MNYGINSPVSRSPLSSKHALKQVPFFFGSLQSSHTPSSSHKTPYKHPQSPNSRSSNSTSPLPKPQSFPRTFNTNSFKESTLKAISEVNSDLDKKISNLRNSLFSKKNFQITEVSKIHDQLCLLRSKINGKN